MTITKVSRRVSGIILSISLRDHKMGENQMKVFVTVLECGDIFINNSRISNNTSKLNVGSLTVFERRVNVEDVVKTLVENGFDVSQIDTEPYCSKIGNIK
jgi:hypothetical protein